MKEEIGNIAGEIWLVLKEKGEIDVSRLSKILREKTLMVYQALGWLAREDKINYSIKGDKTFVSLLES